MNKKFGKKTNKQTVCDTWFKHLLWYDDVWYDRSRAYEWLPRVRSTRVQTPHWGAVSCVRGQSVRLPLRPTDVWKLQGWVSLLLPSKNHVFCTDLKPNSFSSWQSFHVGVIEFIVSIFLNNFQWILSVRECLEGDSNLVSYFCNVWCLFIMYLQWHHNLSSVEVLIFTLMSNYGLCTVFRPLVPEAAWHRVNKWLACLIHAFLWFLLHVSSYSALNPLLIASFDMKKTDCIIPFCEQ